MTIFEQELRKVMDAGVSIQPEYIGNSAYIHTGSATIRILWYNTFSSDNYDALKLKAVSPKTGEMDTLIIKLKDVWGVFPTSNPNYKDGVVPHIWANGKPGWYIAKPTAKHYKALADAVNKYIKVFTY